MRQNFNDGQEVVYSDFLNLQAGLERSFFDRLAFEILQRKENAFFGDSFKVGFLGSTSLTVLAGFGFQTDGAAVSPEPSKKPLYRSANATLNIQAPDGANNRIDIVCAKYALEDSVTESRKYKDPITSLIAPQNVVVRKDENAELLVVAGTASGSPAVPATPAGYVKLAEILVTAVTGIADADAITDARALLPIGGESLMNTVGFSKLTAGAAVPLKTILQDIDDGLGGGGGGAGASWHEVQGEAPVADEEFSQKVYFFAPGLTQKLALQIRVPDGYVPGRPISMKLMAYSPSTSNDFLLRTVSTLIRKNTDAANSTANQHTSTNLALTNTVANRVREISVDITDADGEINSVAVSPGDLINVVLSRAGDSDAEEVRFIPAAIEPKLS